MTVKGFAFGDQKAIPKDMTPQMCLNCGERPAVSSSGSKTVPLCASCASKAGGSRGVKMAPKPSPKPKPTAIKGGKS